MEIRLVNALSLYLKVTIKPIFVKLSIKKAVGIALLLTCIFGAMDTAFAQAQKRRVIQLSGVVLEEDSAANNSRPLGGVHVYVPKAGRGTTTNNMGFFSMPVLELDEIVVSSVGFEKHSFTIAEGSPEYQTLVISLTSDTTFLPEVTIMPFPTEEVFKQAVLAMNLPTDNSGIDKRNFNQELMALMLKTTPMDGYQNQRYYLDQWAGSANNRFQPVTNPFLNPFNWAKFFSSLKKDKKKKK